MPNQQALHRRSEREGLSQFKPTVDLKSATASTPCSACQLAISRTPPLKITKMRLNLPASQSLCAVAIPSAIKLHCKMLPLPLCVCHSRQFRGKVIPGAEITSRACSTRDTVPCPHSQTRVAIAKQKGEDHASSRFQSGRTYGCFVVPQQHWMACLVRKWRKPPQRGFKAELLSL